MINPDKRKAVYLLYDEGVSIRKIASLFNISTSTVMTIIAQKGQMPEIVRKDKKRIDPELLDRLYAQCQGRVQRVYEKLTEEEGIQIGYSTLTQLVREMGLGKSIQKRCGREPDIPGAEMQHDTSPYRIKLGDKWVLVQASLVYFRYSKIRYLKFYRAFDRFKMKCFLHEALMFWGYVALVCIIDNTSLARLKGTGKNAVITPEMERFAKQYGFEFICHEKGHANRKAGNERGFYTVETNFFPGRTFESLEDMNRQAFVWATVRSANRPTGKTRIIPSKTFEYEKPYLTKLHPHIPPPYLVHDRGTDQYGYASFEGNFYWVPGTKRHDVKLLQYSDYLKIYHRRNLLGRYPLPADGVKNELIGPDGKKPPPYSPNNRKKPTAKEESILRKADESINTYLNFVAKGSGKKRHRIIRRLYGLYRKIELTIFIKTVKRAQKYRITDLETVERIAVLQMLDGSVQAPMPEIDQEFKSRSSYVEGRFADDVDLSVYDQMMEDSNG
jgi:transposase